MEGRSPSGRQGVLFLSLVLPVLISLRFRVHSGELLGWMLVALCTPGYGEER